MNKIQSISDIITNSSSEVFIIDTKQHDKIAEFLKDLCEVCGVDFYDTMEIESITRDCEYYGIGENNEAFAQAFATFIMEFNKSKQ